MFGPLLDNYHVYQARKSNTYSKYIIPRHRDCGAISEGSNLFKIIPDLLNPPQTAQAPPLRKLMGIWNILGGVESE